MAINEELSEAYVLGDMKILDEDNSIMLSVSIVTSPTFLNEV